MSKNSFFTFMQINLRFRFWSAGHFRVVQFTFESNFVQIFSCSAEISAFYEIQCGRRPPCWICWGGIHGITGTHTRAHS